MALVDRLDSNIPRLGRANLRLQHYLQQRDFGPPEVQPDPGPLVQTNLSGWDLDTISWGLPDGQQKYLPDGFQVWWSNSDTADPLDGGLKLSVDCRSFSMLWPAGATRSYALAAYRNSWKGEQHGPKVQHGTWAAGTPAASGGGLSISITTVSTTATLGAYGVVLCDASGGAFTVTLPTAAAGLGRLYFVKKIDGSANAVTVAADGAETIDGAATQVLAFPNTTLAIVSDGSAWWVL